MKLVYLVECDTQANSGVVKKITGQFSRWKNSCPLSRLIILAPQNDAKPAISLNDEEVTFIYYPHRPAPLRKLYKTRAIQAARKIIKGIRPDLIYYRQSSWTPGLLAALRIAPRLVVEINSNDKTEMSLRTQCSWLTETHHILTRKFVNKAAHGFVCVTQELTCEYEKYNRPMEVIGNGFDLTRLCPRRPPANRRAQLIFVGSASQIWQGVDKVIQLAGKLKEFDFHIVGEPEVDASKRISENIHFHGLLSWSDLNCLYDRMDIGLGTLALHRKSMEEASPLKVREYLAHGLPVVGAYKDTDCSGCPFYLELPNRESGVEDSVEEIRRFVETWKGRSVDLEWIRDNIDNGQKEAKRLRFFERIINQSVL